MPAQQHPFLADPRVQKLIRRKAQNMVGLFGFSATDRQDLEQEFRLAILKQSAQYDQTKSSIQTFSDRVIAHRIADLIDERQAQCRDWRKTVSLSDPLPGAEDDLTLDDCLDAEGCIDARKSRYSPQQEASDQRRDILRFLALLEPQLRDCCMRLLRQSIAEIARETGEPASTLYDRQRRLRALYRKFEGGKK
ncbi:sigma-70 family RNA polymerase sigma factor [uncultured Desulfovibrio sp.]|uniref:sigma-70 family RNA polymerase sigma factor n=1 Tax=uncultured Desulfovibrio sp. TaxID=167968 RepID=UPI00206516B9|nr:sigma-70 family RNA polymerase sigma factor [uncultured Desulfovibrio sp.]DAV75478.1 MAG TPA: RNA polymerase sigma factor [Caudoviricetes sp.]